MLQPNRFYILKKIEIVNFFLAPIANSILNRKGYIMMNLLRQSFKIKDKNRIKHLKILCLLLISLNIINLTYIPILWRKTHNIKYETSNEISLIGQKINFLVNQYKIDYEILQQNNVTCLFNAHMSKLEKCENKLLWFLEYKKLLENNSFDNPETIYDCFTENELNTLFCVVEAEVGCFGGFEEKCNIASVIFNRLNSKSYNFGESLDYILSQKQFETIRNKKFMNVTPSEETILACEYAFEIEDTTNGAVFFENKYSNIHSSYADYLFTDEAGHKYYKLKKKK